MSNHIFPTFQGWSYEKSIIPVWNTQTYEHLNGCETRIQKWKYPKYKIVINYNFMTDKDIQGITLEKGDVERLQGFINQVGGTANDFLFKDDTENFVEDQVFGVGNGQKKRFQLIRNMPYWAEPVTGIVEKPTILINGIETENYEVSPYGVVTFEEPPAADSVLTWTGGFYFRVRFQEDEIEITRTWQGLWEGIELSMITVKL